ncbi:C-X-C motif chemokine 6-like isoform X2 [Myotis daubentonii]|uniref:C-X-C motif chemokine 6-like isoform X2 n=1 Tax=Myotis daubentonii TaxID=98922 RepID=UPI002873438E|nr:C-X-C motif chemokine 6-like isoform X2 [Myotis daubentonii]
MRWAWGRHSALEFQIPASPPSRIRASRRCLHAAMSLLPRRAASHPGRSGSLCALLALLQLLTLPGPLASAGPSGIIVSELRCVCLTPTHRIRPQMIHHLEMVPAGPGCPNVEIIATMKKGNKVCLDPEAHVVKKIIRKLLNSGKQKN